MKNKYGITEKDMIYELEGFPVAVVVRMMEEQEAQGNKPDVKIFQEYRNSCEMLGGFSWDKTNDGFGFWRQVISEKMFDAFFEKYPVYEKYNKKETNMNKEMKIVPPKGYEIDTENSTFECIKFKKIEKELPKTWEEFCELKPHAVGEYYITDKGVVEDVTNSSYVRGKRILPNKETAEAMLALCQLIQLRDYYNDGWVPDWENEEEVKYSIGVKYNEICTFTLYIYSLVLCFKTEELRDQFLENFRDLIEIAKPLL